VDQPLGLGADDAALRASRDRVAQELGRIADAVATQAYAFLGLSVPAHALRLSPLLGLSYKVDYVERFLPELCAVAETTEGDALVTWIEQRLSTYGKDPRGLIGPGVRAFVEEQRASTSPLASLAALARIDAAF
jgi:hypothetical protein